MKPTALITALCATALCTPLAASAQTDHSTFGVQTGYTSKNSSAIAGLFFQQRLNETWRIAPEVGCVFRHQNLDALTVDINMHYIFDFGSETIGIYPLAGLDFSAWSVHPFSLDAEKDVTTRKSKLGLNVGAGFEYLASPTLKLKAEWKYTLTSHFSTCVVSAGIGYMF